MEEDQQRSDEAKKALVVQRKEKLKCKKKRMLMEVNLSMPRERIANYLDREYPDRIRLYDALEDQIQQNCEHNRAHENAVSEMRLQLEKKIFSDYLMERKNMFVDDHARLREEIEDERRLEKCSSLFFDDVERATRYYARQTDRIVSTREKNKTDLEFHRISETAVLQTARIVEEQIKKTMLERVTMKSGDVEVEKESSCTVCLEAVKVGSSVYDIDCKHIFHKECLENWRKEKDTCPCCRANLK